MVWACVCVSCGWHGMVNHRKGKVKPDAKRGTFANGWSTALHIAAAGGNMDVAKTLIGVRYGREEETS